MRFRTLDIIRGLAILGIVAFHSLPSTQPIDNWLLWVRYAGPWGVSLFFVLSGFSIHFSQIRKEANKNFSCKEFIYKRIKRLYPSYLGAILVAILINVLWSLLRQQDPIFLVPSPSNIISHLLLIHTLHPQTFFGIIPSLWFIGVLVHTYLLYPFFRYLLRIYSLNTTLIFVLAVTLAARLSSQLVLPASASPQLSAFLSNNVPQRWFEWCIGAWIAVRVASQASPSILFSTLTIAALALYFFSHASQPWLSDPLLGIFFGGLIWYIVAWETQYKLHHIWLPLIYLGKLSYPIYLLHQIFVPYVRSVLDPSPFSSQVTFLIIVVSVMIFTWPFSILFHNLLEKRL